MKRVLLLLAAAAVLAPVAAFAKTSPSTTSARADCTKLRAAMGNKAFSQAYRTFGACVAKYAPVEQQATTSAKATCTAQQADASFASTHDGKTFDQYYGTGKKGRDAFGKCVSSVAKANAKAEQKGRMNPARSCKAIRTQLGAATFAQTYGKNRNARNAFGKCVSATARSQAQNEVSASSTCRAQQSDANFAPAHDGKTFDQTYGTNADLSNAFGMCVSSTAKAASTAQQQATVKAAKTCKAARKSDRAAFKAKYRNFGRCVRAVVAKSSP